MDLSRYSVNKLRTELWTCHILSEQRCLRKSVEWADDLLFVLSEEGEEKLVAKLEKELNDDYLFDPKFEHAKSCFELHEYDRAAHIVKNRQDDDRCRFLHFFAMFKAAEKKRIDLMNDITVAIPKKSMLKFIELRDSIERSFNQRDPDSWLLYVYALVLYKFKLPENATSILEKSIGLCPQNWAAWYLLSQIVDDEKILNGLTLPNHIFKVFFYYMIKVDLDVENRQPWTLVCFKDVRNFLDKYFADSIYIRTLHAKSWAYRPMISGVLAISEFEQIRSEDPNRIDAMDVYSNLLYTQEHHKELSRLACDIEAANPMSAEANLCIANSYSARKQHAKAIAYLTRALRLNPDHLNSWTLIGHEYREMKSFDKALQAYRFALSINKRDCRAWLGLGNTYELLIGSPTNTTNPMYDSCLYYYSQVAKYRPRDYIMFMFMSSIFEKMGQTEEAAKCREKANQVENANNSLSR